MAMNGWLKIADDGRITVMMSKSEMGQGIHTALAMLLADELDADWARVGVEMSPINPIYNNVVTVVDGLPFHPDDHGLLQRTASWLTSKTMREVGVMMTGGSSSVKDLWLPMRQAGASARAMLVNAAAMLWGLDAKDINVQQSVVSHASGRSATFGDLVGTAARQPLPHDPVLKRPDQFTLIGRPTTRIDAKAKHEGKAVFGIDVLLPEMLYATVVHCPTLGGSVRSFIADTAHAMPGVKHVISVDGYNGGSAAVAVIADTPFHAMRAVNAVIVDWDHGEMQLQSSVDVFRTLSSALDTENGYAYYQRGDVADALASAKTTVSAEYMAPFLAHAAMEPVNCTVQYKDGRGIVWASTQVPDIARRAVANVLGISENNVDVKVQYLGGGFGRRLDVDFIAQAAAIAKVADGVPVQTIWTREQDTRHDFYRPGCVSRCHAGLDAAGALVAWKATSAGQAIVPQALHRYFGTPAFPIDKTTSEGAFDQPYEHPSARIAHHTVTLPIPIGFWRSVGHSHQAFFTECFMDEVATAAKRDPIEFRLALLRHHPRHAAVLRRVAEIAGWSTPELPPTADVRRGRGVALHESFGSVVAQIADVDVDAANGFRVTRVACVIDCGLPVNPNIIRQQIEGGIVFALSAALHGEITIENGRVKQGNYNDYQMVRMQDTPTIVIDIMPSSEHPEGVGEPPVPPLAPAVANALFAATGRRVRSLPLRLA